MTRTHNMQNFGEIPFVKPQNDTETVKRLKTTNTEKETCLILVDLLWPVGRFCLEYI